MKAHLMELPRRVVVGFEILGETGKLCRELGFQGKILLVSGPRTYQVAGKTVQDALEDSGFETLRLLVEEPTLESVEKAEKALKDVVLAVAVGGGKVIDVAKLASARVGVPFISCPTAASHDGIASPQASLRSLESPTSVKAQAPLAILADLEVILKAPYRLTSSGCGDILAKFTAVRDWWPETRSL